MIASENIHTSRVFDFESEKQADGLYALSATINVVS